MNRHLTPERFLSLWAAAGGDDFPFPLRYRSTARWEDEHVANLSAADRWRRQADDPALEHAIRILRTGEIAVEVYGRATDPAEDIFVRGSTVGTYAVLAQQFSTSDHIHVTTTTTDLLARSLVGLLPIVQPGRAPEQRAPTREVVAPSDTRAVRPPLGGTGSHALRSLLLRERSATGSIRFLLTPTGTAHTPVPDTGWFDVVDDGRYLFVSGTETRVAPAGPDALRRALSAQVDRTLGALRPVRERTLRPY